jgi:hypothetical protein
VSTTWQFYDRETGLFAGRSFTGPDRALAANTPRGFAAIEGRYDRHSQRVDVASGVVVAYERPAAEIEAEQKTAREQQARHRIAELELAQHRPMRELVIDPSNAEAKRRLQEIEGEIAGLRVGARFPLEPYTAA